MRERKGRRRKDGVKNIFFSKTYEVKVFKPHFIFFVRDFHSLKIIFEIAGAFLVF